MARTRVPRRRRSAKQGRNVRVHLRKLQQAIDGAVTVVTPPSDPPRINATRIIPLVTSVDIVTSKLDSVLSTNGNGTSVLSIKLSPTSEIQKFSLTGEQIFQCYRTAINLSPAASFQIALHKVSFWGPLPNQAQTSVAMSLNYGPDSNFVQMAQDQGTATTRPRVGFSLPQVHWSVNSTQKVVEVEVYFGSGAAPSIGVLLGTLHLSMSMRPNGI